MPVRARRRPLVWEGLKILGVLLVFYAIQQEISRMRYDLYGNGTRVASAQSRRQEEVVSAQRGIEETILGCTDNLERTKAELEASLVRVARDNEELRRFFQERTSELEGSILRKLDSERQEFSHARAVIDDQRASLQRLTTTLERDPDGMKHKMLLPTTQLRGNGTVGSGVIVYSELQPDASDGDTAPATTFVLTAYHVVVEVLGDRLERGILNEVHVLLENEPDTSRVYSAKVVLFDRVKDVALLRLNTQRRFLQVAALMRRPELGKIDVFTRAYAVGCPLGNHPLPTLGEISSKSKLVGDQTFWMLSAPTFFGNSGGGVYLAETCELIGISSMIYTYGKANPAVVPHMGLLVPLETIYQWLDAEGYSFIHERRPIPKEMLWKLVHLDKSAPLPRTAAGKEQAAPAPHLDGKQPPPCPGGKQPPGRVGSSASGGSGHSHDAPSAASEAPDAAGTSGASGGGASGGGASGAGASGAGASGAGASGAGASGAGASAGGGNSPPSLSQGSPAGSPRSSRDSSTRKAAAPRGR